ncbi:MAG TPA: ABC transporter ATP-binding protein [Coprothermobacter proteolyticus]|nr:ABC transporter ATP-binding protein [Coprothermobacter sp.]NLT83602.1 ABC transporter ATP-binding protein [Coprothermobacter proteolyticus]HOA64819.1 ABC transporter ATP-binding protein [Coprothermobacter proteolyticus]HOK24397.1 ABC transporter ATP-binding protein [Coprothermobacter proteolyticus]HOL53328.1 ABC transporter ATP-binding protein [Coprothermobacter proteolyticus]
MIKLLSEYLKPYWKYVLLVVLLLTFQAVMNLYLPNLNADIINNGVVKGDVDYIWKTGGLMLAATFLVIIVSVISTYFASKTAMSFGRDLRNAVFEKVLSFSQAELEKFGVPTLITRNTNDVYQMQMMVQIGLTMIVTAPIMAAGSIIMALRQDVVLSYSILIIVPLMGAVVGIMIWIATPLFRSVQKKIDRVNQVLREKLMGVRVIRAFVKDDYEARRFDQANKDLMQTTLKVNRLMAFGIPSLMAIMNLAMVAIVWFGSIRIDSGAMPIGNLTAFLTYVMQIVISVMVAMGMFIMVPRAEASAERILSVLETNPSIESGPDVKVSQVPLSKGLLEFKDVEFRYPGAERPVLRDISFSAEPGQFTAIVGSTGAGKSTLVNLIPRFYDVTDGQILLDGVDIRDIPVEDLRARISLVPQKAFLFRGTVEENLKWGNENATTEELWHALEIAQAKEFVMDMPGQLQAFIDQAGANVSGGQRQRLSIARALVKKADVYVFDDCFSALDFKTESLVRSALREELKDATVIIVAQRVSSIMDADKIVVLNDDGTIAGIGTHDELLKTCRVYQEIVYSQLSKEEIA